MREKYESLALVQLKELAKVRGLKGTSAMKKAELVEAMLAEDERISKLEQNGSGKDNRGEEQRPAGGENPAGRKGSSGETGHPGTRRPGRHRVSVVRNDAARRPETDARQQDAFRQDARQQDASRQEPQKPEGVRPEIQRPEQRPESRRPEPQRTEYQGAEPPRGGAPRTEEGRRTEPAQQETPFSAPGAQAGQAGGGRARVSDVYDEKSYPQELDSGEEAHGILEVMPDGYGFIRCDNYLPGENDVYVAPSQIRRFGLKTGDILRGNKRVKTQQEKFSALLFIRSINGYTTEESAKRVAFEDMTPIFPNQRIRLEIPGCSLAMRAMDLVSPVGKGQRGMIVSPPKAGKTTLLKEVAKSILRTNPGMHMLILLIDERPEEVTDIKEAIHGSNVEVIHSTFDELPEHHKRVSEMVIERAKRLVEHKKDVVILLDSITRLARAYNLVVPPSGRTLSGGLDPAALHMPKRFFGAARNMREGGSLTILATALVDTGSKMDDVVYEEFKGTGNMEMILDRKLSEKRIFPAIDLAKSGTRREDLLLSADIMRRALNGLKPDEATDRILDLFARTRNNNEFVQMVKKNKFV